MLSFLHFPCVLTLSHNARSLTYMAYTKDEVHSRFISFYRKYCEGSGGEYQLIITPTDTRAEYKFTLRLPERSPGAAIMTPRELFGILRRQFAIQYAPVVIPDSPVKLTADSWEDLL